MPIFFRPRPRRQYIGAKSGYKGVYENPNLKKRRWRAYIRHHSQYITIGYYETKDEAAKAFNEAAKKLQGKNAFLNTIR